MSNKPWHEAVSEKLEDINEMNDCHLAHFAVANHEIIIDSSLSAEEFHELCRVTLRALGEID